jgi:hypothetical protein
MSTPVLIVAYSRHENVVRLINDLYVQGVTNVYLAIDGSRNGNAELQSKIESSALGLAVQLGIEIRIWKRDVNLGPAVSVITAIDWFFENVEAGIILEDDLFLSPDAVHYFQASIARYSTVEKVFMVSGSNYFETETPSSEVLATHYPVIWGWATWADRWSDYRTAMNSLQRANIPGSISERWFWKIGTQRCLFGIKDAWDIPLAAYQLSVGRLTLIPPVNLVSNRGADGFAGNTHVDEWPLNIPVKTLISTSPEREFFNNIEVSREAIETTDELFRHRIYGIRATRTLPTLISKFLDIFRYPLASRSEPLLERLNQVNFPI